MRTDASNGYELPVAVIGAGPVGLAAAAHLLQKGETPLLLEAGDSIAANVRAWGHVRLFSPWKYNIDNVAGTMLEESGWQRPDAEQFPTGNDLVEQYLAPLAELPQLQPYIRLSTRVISVARYGFDKMKTVGRDEAPFLLHLRSANGAEETILAKAVIDASGTYATPNPLGASGVLAPGEAAHTGQIFPGIPDVLGKHRSRYAGRRVLVVGSGHSAFNAVLDLVNLTDEAPGTQITWAVRRDTIGHLFGGGENDLLPERGALGLRVRHLVEDGTVRLVTGFKLAKMETVDGDLIVTGEQGEVLEPLDEIIATTGFRPDLEPLRELRLGLDTAVESPTALAPMIDPNLHSCGTVRPHGAIELAHPETDFYIVGMKSYGRAPTFLMMTGYEQVRSVVCAITGDMEGARAVELELPETGVCSANLSFDGAAQAVGNAASSCCSTSCCSSTEAESAPELQTVR